MQNLTVWGAGEQIDRTAGELSRRQMPGLLINGSEFLVDFRTSDAYVDLGFSLGYQAVSCALLCVCDTLLTVALCRCLLMDRLSRHGGLELLKQ